MPRKTVYGLVTAAVLALIAGAFAGGFVFGHVSSRQAGLPVIGTPKALQLIEDARNIIKQKYVKNVPDSRLSDGSVAGMVKSLNDRYSQYIPPRQMGTFKAHTLGEFSGVGITLGMRDKKVTVVRPLPGTPAMRAGIHKGDTILTIDGKSTAKLSLAAASEKIRGPKGTEVTLGIRRGKKLLTFPLIRATISLPSVKAEVLAPGFGYVAVQGFNPNTGADVEREIMNLERKRRVKGVIVDLRDNPGGLVESAVEVASVFIPRGPIVSIKGRDGQPQIMNALEDEYHTRMKLVVLVNANSASASEIFAGAVQDANRGLVVGVKTYGKASVQTIEELPNGGALKFTSAHYYTPKGRLIDHIGIKPDVVADGKADPMTFGTKKDTQRQRALEVLRQLVAGKIKS